MLDAMGNGHTFRPATEANIEGKDLGENEWTVMLVMTSIPENVQYDDIYPGVPYVIENGMRHYYIQDYHWYRQMQMKMVILMVLGLINQEIQK